jgi:hypothetical protein
MPDRSTKFRCCIYNQRTRKKAITRTLADVFSQDVYRAFCSLTVVFAMSVVLNAQGQSGLPAPGNHSAAAGDCPKCNAGEFSTTAEKLVARADYVYVENPPCSSDVNADVTKLGWVLEDAALPGLSDAAGPLVDHASADAAKFIGAETRGAVGELLSKYANPRAQCELVCVVIPKDATVRAYSFMAGDGDRGVGKCENDSNGWIGCSVGYSKWDEPREVRNEETHVTCATFMNWSRDRARRASMTVYYTTPAGKKPVDLR